MKIKQIRNATLKVTFGGVTFLVDPWLVKKHGMGSFVDIPGHPFSVPDPVKEQLPMPFYDLPEPVEKVLEGVDYYLLTHIHPDHIDMSPDGTIGAPLDKNIPILTQNEQDAAVLKKSGFKNITVMTEQGINVGKVKIIKTPTLHGTIKPEGKACGVIFETAGEEKLYIVGDTIWYEKIKETLLTQKPDVIVMNTCAAELVGNGRLIMNDEDVECVAVTSPQAKIVLSHMDNVAHATITRKSMRGLMAMRGIENYYMPADGETLTF
ncbi:MAG: MBL fold metallo-hydrolase [Selenomonadaceae bacterium]|nr:MBL fold metallo-hydrolase [Selenomonadaceae bacterium]